MKRTQHTKITLKLSKQEVEDIKNVFDIIREYWLQMPTNSCISAKDYDERLKLTDTDIDKLLTLLDSFSQIAIEEQTIEYIED